MMRLRSTGLLVGLMASLAGGTACADQVTDARLARLDRSYDVHPDLTYVETTDVDTTLFTARSLREHDRSTKTFTPASQSLEVMEAWVDQPDGSRVEVGVDGRFTRPSEAAQNAPGFSSAMTTTLLYPQLRLGSRTHVRWKMTQKTPPLLGFSVWAEPPLAEGVDEAHITISLPPNLSLQWRARDFAVTDVTTAGKRVIAARLSGTQGETPERDMVATADFQPLFLATTLGRPEDLGAIYWQASLAQVKVTPRISALAQRLAGGRQGEAAARAVYDWVTRNIRYVAVYLDPNDPWVPHEADQVLRAGYGDCKDHVVLMQALLGALGVRAQAALIDWGDRMSDLPLLTPQAFNHAIVYLPDTDRFLNPTDPYARFESLDGGLTGKIAVIATPEGRLERTPITRPRDNAYEMEQSLTLGADGALSGSARFKMSPNIEGGVRAMVARASSTQDLANRFLAGSPEGGFGEFRSADPRDLSADLDMVGTWRSPHAAIFHDGLADLPVPVGLDIDPPARLRRYLTAGPRRHPVLVGATEDTWATRINLPPGVTVARLPEDVSLRNEAGSYTATYRRSEHGLHVERRLEIFQDVFQPAQAAALEDLLYAPIDDARATLTLAKAQAEASVLP